MSFAAVDALICGYIGLHADASANAVITRSAVEDGEWAQIMDAPLWGGSIDLKHESRCASELTNRTGRTIKWTAQFENGNKSVEVAPGETKRVEI